MSAQHRCLPSLMLSWLSRTTITFGCRHSFDHALKGCFKDLCHASYFVLGHTCVSMNNMTPVWRALNSNRCPSLQPWLTLAVSTCPVSGASWASSGPSCLPCLPTATAKSLQISASSVTSKGTWNILLWLRRFWRTLTVQRVAVRTWWRRF